MACRYAESVMAFASSMGCGLKLEAASGKRQLFVALLYVRLLLIKLTDSLILSLSVPLKNIHLNKDKCNQPQESIPEIQEIPFKTPVDCISKKNGVKHRLYELT